ncbi:metal-dependent protein hydrolase [Bombardia bombarda]|uniref:Metal-dependent protein hydrolase n=1 Tax=Bombardia bombarda TaxID=252184 RepID=A0AA39WGJ3_9PEZI|nr:metal-dependent protein hydrolase [Bombardia bombarda]
MESGPQKTHPELPPPLHLRAPPQTAIDQSSPLPTATTTPSCMLRASVLSILKMAAESAPKKLCTTIGTHNGHFHADEALAVYILRKHVAAYKDAKLVRTRDPALLKPCSIVVDVGGEFKPKELRFDHHQSDFEETFSKHHKTKLSSAGLVYKEFGREILAATLHTNKEDELVGLVYNKFYEGFIEALDAHDNGIAAYDNPGERKFSEDSFTLGAMVGRRNPRSSKMPSDPVEAQAVEDKHFEIASQRIGEEFDYELEYYTSVWPQAGGIVESAYNERKQYDPDGRIIVFKGHSAAWKDHLFTLEAEQQGGPDVQKENGEEQKGKEQKGVLYVLYPESAAPGSKWRIQCVPDSKGSFNSRKKLPAAWKGLRDEELDDVAGIEGCVFVHPGRFMGGNKTFEGALAMAKKALETPLEKTALEN